MSAPIFWANFMSLAIIAGAAFLFLRRKIPLRHRWPEILQNGLWFSFTFLLTPFVAALWIILLPISALTALIAALVPSQKAKGPILWAVFGIWASAIILGTLYLIAVYHLY